MVSNLYIAVIKQQTFYRTDDMQPGKNVHSRMDPPGVRLTSLYIIILIMAYNYITQNVSKINVATYKWGLLGYVCSFNLVSRCLAAVVVEII